MKRAKGPSNLHSPPSAPGLDPRSPPFVELEDAAAVTIASMAETVEEDVKAGAVEEATISAVPAGSDVVAVAARIENGASSGSDM